jgi:hypothetical protein
MLKTRPAYPPEFRRQMVDRKNTGLKRKTAGRKKKGSARTPMRSRQERFRLPQRKSHGEGRAGDLSLFGFGIAWSGLSAEPNI